MTGMTYHFSKAGRNVDSLSNRGCSSGGSCGGNKKAGIVTFGTTWKRGNMGNYLVRAPQRSPTLQQTLFLTTNNPVQYNRNGYYATHSGRLG